MNGLMGILREQGADIDGIMERFLGDETFYTGCFKEFMQDENFVELGKAIKAQNYRYAFECAHALKGVAGNLGLLPLYRAVSDIVDALRAEKYDSLENLYRDFISCRDIFIAVLE